MAKGQEDFGGLVCARSNMRMHLTERRQRFPLLGRQIGTVPQVMRGTWGSAVAYGSFWFLSDGLSENSSQSSVTKPITTPIIASQVPIVSI